MLKIEKYLQENGESKTNTIAEHLGLLEKFFLKWIHWKL